MQYKDIELFLDLVQSRNITKTAERMFLSQSTVSNRLKNLEAELGYELMKRSKGRQMVRLTHQGELFIPLAVRWKNLHEETMWLQERALQTLRIAANESTYYEILNYFLIGLLRKHPQIKLSINICDTAQVYDLLEKNLADYGFASYESSRENIYSECIYEQIPCIIQCAEDSAPGETIHPQNLDPEKEICLTGGNFTVFKKWREKWFGQQYAGRIEINTSRAAIPFIKELGYWALCTIENAKFWAQEINVRVYQLEDPPEPRQIFFLKLNDNHFMQSSLSKMFEQELKDHMAAINGKYRK